MFRRDCLFRRFIAHRVGFGRYQLDPFYSSAGSFARAESQAGQESSRNVPTQQSTMTSFASLEHAISGGNISAGQREVVSAALRSFLRRQEEGFAGVDTEPPLTLDELEHCRFGQSDIVVSSFSV